MAKITTQEDWYNRYTMNSSSDTQDQIPHLSLIIVSYNTKEITLNCIESVYASFAQGGLSDTFEIVVVDNKSSDGSVEALMQLQTTKPNLHVIQNTTNTGFGPANNQGVRAARGRYILLLNSDIIVHDDAIPRMVQYYREHEKTQHFLGGKLLNQDGSPQPSCGPFYTPWVVFGALFLRGDYWGLTRFSPQVVREVDWVSGACILTKKEHFEAVGGFDEKIFMYMEEIDLFYRAKKQGLRVFFYPEAQFTHLGSASSGGKTYPILQVYRGFLYLYRKHYGWFSIFLLKSMLKWKAFISYMLGFVTRNTYLTKTYAEAYRITQKDR